jgi:predicted HTH domain antitoxin
MNRQIQVSYPDSLAELLKMGNREFEKEMRLLSIMKLYETGKISSGMAAGILGFTRVEFLEKLADYQISIFQLQDDKSLDEDITNA